MRARAGKLDKMNHLPFSITAYLLNGVAVTVDKFLLSKHIPDPLVYVFYFSLVSLVGLLLIPFAQVPSTPVILIASLSTLLWTTGAYFMFKALQIGLVTRVVPVIGTLIPLFLLMESVINYSITPNQVVAVLFLVLGLIFLTSFDWKGKIRKEEIVFIILSSIFFAVSYSVLRQAYVLADNFFSVFVYSRPVLVPVGIALFILPQTRERIFPRKKQEDKEKLSGLFTSKAGIFFAGGQICAGISELLLTFSVSLANPALVNSLQGVQYVFLFLMNLVLAKKYPHIFSERLTSGVVVTKTIGILAIGVGLYILSINATNNLY